MWPLIILGALAKWKASSDASRRQGSLRSAMEAYQRQRARETEGATEQLIAKQSPKERDTELANVTADRAQSMRDTVGAAQAFDAKPIAGKLSGDYQAAQESTAARVSERTRRAIEQLSAIGAPGEQKQRFGLRFGKAAGTVDAANRASENVGRSYMTDIENTRPNQLLSTLGDVGMMAGAGMANSGAGAGAAAQPNLVSPRGIDWGSLDAGPGAYNVAPSWKDRLARGFSLWGS